MTNLTSVSIGNSVTSIGDGAFDSCSGLKSFTIPNSVTSIGDFAFYGCSGLTSVTIPNSVTTIGNNAFYGCSGLTRLTIPGSVTIIGDKTFYNCSGLTSIICKANTPPTAYSNTFGGTTPQSNIELNVPSNSFLAYRNHSIWGNFRFGYYVSGTTQGPSGFTGSGLGTEDDPYLIFNPIQLHNVRNFTGREGVVFKLMADIDLTQFLSDNNPSQGWEPIGVQDSPFMGVFHGEGHTIKGMFINRTSTDFIGLFGFAENATFDNVTIECQNITGANNSGSFCGYAFASSFTGVTSRSLVEGKSQTGGFAGYLRYCTANDIHHVGNVGGTDRNVGGLIGYLECSDLNTCSHSGTVTGANNTGGIAGVVKISSLQNVTNTATVNGANYTGGVFGNIGDNGGECTATGVISKATVSGQSSVGGFAGYGHQLNATQCYADGNVTAQADNTNPIAGGFVGLVGYNDKYPTLTLNECGYIGDINARAGVDYTSSAGGLIGYVAKAQTLEINNSFAIGDFTADGNAGGLLGYIGSVGNATIRVSNSYYSGWLTGNENVGGIVGYGNHVTLDKNYAGGYATGSRYVGGIAGTLLSGSTVTGCVATQGAINAVNGDVGRVYGTADNTCTMGKQGTGVANRGMTTMNVVSQGLQLTVDDGAQHGTSLGKGLLKYKSSYQGLNWDFTNDWTILETESYPYKPSQCAPPMISSQLVSGDTSLSGQCAEGAMVYVRIGQDEYEAQVTGTNWTATVPAMQSGVTVKAYTVAEGLLHSYYVTSTVAYPGEGTEQSPYLIYTANDLANINSYSYYKLMNNIDLTNWIADHNPERGWQPVGSNGGSTMKQLDGDGHTISGLWLISTSNNAGLISGMDNSTIKNLHVITADGKAVNSSADYVGIIAGKSVNCTFENVSVRGTVSGNNYVGAITGYDSNSRFSSLSVDHASISGASYVGGIAGEVSTPLKGLIVKSATITATGDKVGGLVGSTAADIVSCLAEVTLSGKDYIGGIAGYSTAAIEQSASYGSVSTTDLVNCRAGGIVGYTSGDIANCYSSAETRGGQYAGGIAGYSFGKIDYCYSSGDLYATNFGGGIVGYLDGSAAAVNNCFAINNKIDVSDQNGVALRVIGGFKNGAATPQANNYALKTMVVSVNDVTQRIYDDLLHGISLTDDQLKLQATYVAQGWDFTETWGIDEGKGYPYLLAISELEEPEFIEGDANGDGTVNVSDYVTTASYILEQDPQPFVFAAVDLDGNNEINVADLVGVASLALSYEGAPRRFKALTTVAPQGSATMEALLASNDVGYTVSVDLSNSLSISALQLDLNLPDGVTLSDATLSDRATASHQLATSRLSNGSYRLLASSSTCKALRESTGTILTLTLTGKATGIATLGNITLATPDAHGITLDNISLNLGTTGINDVTSDARIYREGNNIVVESPAAGVVNIVSTTGMNVSRKVNAGRNVISSPFSGIVIVKMNNNIVKLQF